MKDQKDPSLRSGGHGSVISFESKLYPMEKSFRVWRFRHTMLLVKRFAPSRIHMRSSRKLCFSSLHALALVLRQHVIV